MICDRDMYFFFWQIMGQIWLVLIFIFEKPIHAVFETKNEIMFRFLSAWRRIVIDNCIKMQLSDNVIRAKQFVSSDGLAWLQVVIIIYIMQRRI